MIAGPAWPLLMAAAVGATYSERAKPVCSQTNTKGNALAGSAQPLAMNWNWQVHCQATNWRSRGNAELRILKLETVLSLNHSADFFCAAILYYTEMVKGSAVRTTK